MSRTVEEIAAACPPLRALLAAMEEPARHRLQREARPMRMPAGTVLFRPGEACSQYLIVIDGAVRVDMASDTGREILLYRVGPGQTCVLTTLALISGAPYEAEGKAETEVRALTLPAAAFDELLVESAAFRRFVFTAFAMRITDLMHLLRQIAFARLNQRLAAFLLHHADPEGALRLTHQDIAAELGASREAVSRLLKAFEQQGLVALSRARIRLLDVAAMRKMIASAPSFTDS
jgi:CRP/FNR family transcriptional regulator